MGNLKKQFAALVLCFAMVFTFAGDMSAMAMTDNNTYTPLYWVDNGGNYINGIDTPFEQTPDNDGHKMELYYKNESDAYTAIDKTTFANVQKSGDIGFFGWVDPGANSLFWNTENIEAGTEGSAIFTVGTVSYCIRLKVVASTPAEEAAKFIQKYVTMESGSPMIDIDISIIKWEELKDDVKAEVNAQLAITTFSELAKSFVQTHFTDASNFFSIYVNSDTINIQSAYNISKNGGAIYQYLADNVKSDVNATTDTIFAHLKADGTTLTFPDIAAAADFIYEHLNARFADTPYMITKVNANSSNDELYMVRNGEADWGALSDLQKTAVNNALVKEDADAMTYEAMLAYAKEGSSGNGDGDDFNTYGTPYDTSKVKELSVDEVVAILTDDSGNFNFTNFNPNLDTIEEIWLLYKGTYGYDNEDSIREELFNRYGNTKYGPKSDPLTVVDGFNRLTRVGWFIYGHLSTIDSAVYVWEAEVNRCLNKQPGGMKTAGIRFTHDAVLTKAEQALLDTYLETSIHEGFQIAKKCLQESETAVEEFKRACLTDYVTGEPITEENVMLVYEADGDYIIDDHSDNPFNVIVGEAVFREVFSNKQREQIDELCGGKGEYHKLLRLAQAYLLTRFDSSLSVENALAVVTSKGVGTSFVKLINDALMYDIPVSVEITAKVTNSLSDADKAPLDNALKTSDELEGYNIENYQDVSVKVFVDEELIEDIHETNGEVTFEVGQAEESKNYKLLRNHNGTVEVLDVEETEAGSLLAKSDKFSAYALVSTRSSNNGGGGNHNHTHPSEDDTPPSVPLAIPASGDNTTSTFFLVSALMLLALGVLSLKKKHI